MRKVIVNEWMTLDGVVQAPGGEEEDTSSSFRHGGWHMPYLEEVSQQRALESIVGAGGFVLGRRTYEIFAAYWPNAGDEEQVIAEPLNTKRSTSPQRRSPIRSTGRTRPCSRARSRKWSPS